MTIKIFLLLIIALLLVTDYVLVVIAHEADERAERMRKKESKGNGIHKEG